MKKDVSLFQTCAWCGKRIRVLAKTMALSWHIRRGSRVKTACPGSNLAVVDHFKRRVEKEKRKAKKEDPK